MNSALESCLVSFLLSWNHKRENTFVFLMVEALCGQGN